MSKHLCFSFRFLQPVSHGRSDGGIPEWPPSPMRMYQAVAAAAAARWNERQQIVTAEPALRWLEHLQAPTILASSASISEQPYLLYVPNNTADLLVPAWRSGDVTKGVKREQKPVRSLHIADDAIHYLFPIPTENCEYLDILTTAARSVTHLGWGIDMVVGDARLLSADEVGKLPGHSWRPVKSGGTPLRVPRQGTLSDLMRKHHDFLHRLSDDGFKPVPPLRAFNVVSYHSPTIQDSKPFSPRPFATFELHRTNAELARLPAGKSRFRPFHTARFGKVVAGMLRHAASQKAKKALGWDDAKIASAIDGHGSDKNGQATTDERLMFIPLPSITPVGVESIRRVLIVGPAGYDRDIERLAYYLHGQELVEEGTKVPQAMLSQIKKTDQHLYNYIESATAWSTVTPVLLPGFDDPDHLRRKLKGNRDPAAQKRYLQRLDDRIEELLCKAFRQAGYSAELVEQLRRERRLEWRQVGFRAGVELARRYEVPANLKKFPAWHVRVRFAHPVAGPLVIGAGRYRGFGLFAAESPLR